MSVAYSVGLSLLLDTSELADERRLELVSWLARQPGVGAFRDLAGGRAIEATRDGARFVGASDATGGVSMPSDFAIYIEDLMEADALLPVLAEELEVDAAPFADTLRLEGRTTLRLQSHAWARARCGELLAEAAELDDECPEDASDLREFCTQLLADLDKGFAIALGVE